MTTIETLEAWHLRHVLLDIRNVEWAGRFTDYEIKDLKKRNDTYAVLKDGRPVACIGIDLKDGEVWSFLCDKNPAELLIVYRAFKKLMSKYMNGRVLSTYIETNFNQAHRWIKLFGFQSTGEILPNYTERGGSVVRYTLGVQHAKT